MTTERKRVPVSNIHRLNSPSTVANVMLLTFCSASLTPHKLKPQQGHTIFYSKRFFHRSNNHIYFLSDSGNLALL